MDNHAALDLATGLARAAAGAILAVRADARRTVTSKSDASPVTAADLAADAVLRKGLAVTGDAIVTEETWVDAPMPPRGRVWVIDPIDGTEDFVRGTADYAIHIGLVVDGAPRLGVVLQPATGIAWRGVVGDDASVCERIDADGATTRLSLPASGPLAGPPRIAASVSHPSAFVDFVVGDLGGVVVPRGSVGLKAALIVEGKADAYVTASRRIKVWDTAAPAALLLAAGGAVSSLSQRPLVFDGPVGHDDGVCFWSRPARDALRAPLQDALVRFTRTTPQ
ncbi:MAG: 3'(2'),5'-bisphosphate nucleotidase CysQ [Deltaproteobacteria bacterium]|nr:3'(2'),5'-bisphosphate nucleotidase CysQ [Deltaproteobacteria bacterium]